MDTEAVCNIALAHLGMQPIDDIDDDNPSAKACSRYFEASRDDVLREHRWPFATVQQALVEIDDDDYDVIGWDYTYTYPTSAVTVWTVYNEASVQDKNAQEFEVIYNTTLGHKVICTDQDDAYCDISYIIEDPDKWDAKFTEAFTYKLAAKMSHQLTGDPAIGLKMMEVYSAVLGEAKRVGATEKRKKPHQESGYINSR